MAEYVALAHGVYCIDALYVKPQVAAIYLLQQADEVAIIETGTYYSVPNVLATLAELGIAKPQVKYVIPTHVHLDHAGGAGEMMRQFEQASLIIHPRGARHMIDPQKLIAGTIDVYGEAAFNQLYGSIEPIAEARVELAPDLACFDVGGRELIFIDTPGHARHHFCIYDQLSDGVFTGDTFGISYAPMKQLVRGLIPTTPPVQFDPPALRQSISRIMSFNPSRLYLTHYGEFVDPAAQVSSFNQWIDEYVDLCRQMENTAADYVTSLEQALQDLILKGLAGDDNAMLRRILQTDIRLNAQGLAHWRSNTQDG
jgi:glyoxylase-like metal-dependent hydrolase (beta-lactamase superfamily II)